ncbi:MAG: AbgT family transporter [Cellvibrionaceae bacterium]
MNANLDSSNSQMKGVLGWIERSGNRLPDPVFIFFWLILGVFVLSGIAAFAGWSAPHPTKFDTQGQPEVVSALSLLSADNIRRLWVEMPATFAHFHPLGYVLVVMLGAGVAERSGLFETAMRAAVKKAPTFVLTPMVALVAMMANLAADAAYVVLIPLAGVLYLAAGRHPIAGIAAAFAGVSGGFSANLLPGQLDALLFGITEQAAETIAPAWDANIAGNWYFMAAMTLLFVPVIWFVTDKIIEPKLTPLDNNKMEFISENEFQLEDDGKLSALERKGLNHAGLAALGVVVLWLLFTIGPGTPLIDETAKPEAQLTPLYKSLVAGFLVLFLATGWAYGAVCGSIKSHRDVVRMMSESMADLAYYLVLAFAAAHFVAVFAWSNLGLIFAIKGAGVIENSGLPMSMLLGSIVLFAGVVNLFIGSASAKWALLAPVLVPMMMLLGVSPEMTTAAYRVGDSATNIVTPLMPYFPLILTFCQRWQKDFGLGSLAATMIPYSVMMLVAGLIMTIVWVVLGAPLGPGAHMNFQL